MKHSSFVHLMLRTRGVTQAMGLALLLVTIARATVHQVPSEIEDLQQALDACQSGDTVLVDRGVYCGLFTLPECDVHLYSHHVLTGDTLDVEQTVLDGELAGSILSTAEGRYHLAIQGFTFLNGQGAYYGSRDQHGGGLDALNYETMYLSHCVFRNCQTTGYRGAAIMHDGFADPPSRSCLVRNCTLVNNQQLCTDTGPNTTGSAYLYADTVSVRNVKAFTTDFSGFSAFYARSESYTTISGVHIERMFLEKGELLKILSHGGCFLSDASIRNCRIDIPQNNGEGAWGYFVNVRVDSQAVIRDFSLENCVYTCYNGYPGDDRVSCYLSGTHFSADSVLVTGCHGDSGSFISLGTLGAVSALESDAVRHLVVEDCSYGQEEYRGDPDNPCILYSFVQVGGVDLYDSRFQRITGMTHNLPVSGPYSIGNTIRGVLMYYSGRVDTCRIARTRFLDNLIIDRDLNTPVATWAPNTGRSLSMSCGPLTPVCVLDSCEFIEQRQPNWIPEREDAGLINEVGNAVSFDGYGFLMRGCVFEGIDDGGIKALCDGDVTIENCAFVDVDRAVIGLAAWQTAPNVGGYYTIRGTLIKGSRSFDCMMPDQSVSSQKVLHIAAHTVANIENVTITDCSLISLMRTELNHEALENGVHFRNCLIYDNSYQQWQSSLSSELDTLHFCLSQEVRPGDNNVFGNDPLFDPERGIPFLAPDSPCIDAGNPDAAYNDIEDLDAPGFALWPSQGGLRNDIGCTGGPYANDSMFVSVAPGRPITLPTSPTLGDAYPNPFNPTTTIPFVIHQPTHLRLAVYNLRGQLVATLADTNFPPGEHRVTFDGSSLASGVYLISMHGEDVSHTSKVLLLK